MADLPDDIKDTQSQLQDAARNLKAGMDALVALSTQSSAPLQQAQLHQAFMNSAVSIASVLHTLHGGSADAIVFKAEQTTVKAYQAKVQKAVAKEELKQLKKSTEINIDAAHRFITHAIPELSEQQKSGLKEAAAKSRTRLNEAPLLAQARRSVHDPVRAAKGQTAIERLQQRSSGGKASKRDAAEAFLDELETGDNK